MLRLLSAMAAALQRPSRAYLCSLWAHSFSSPLLSAAIDRVTHQVIPWRFPGLHADLLHGEVPRGVSPRRQHQVDLRVAIAPAAAEPCSLALFIVSVGLARPVWPAKYSYE